MWPLNLLAVLDFDTRLGRQVVEVEDLAVGAFDGEYADGVRAMLDDDELGFRRLGTGALALFFHGGRFRLLSDVFVANRYRPYSARIGLMCGSTQPLLAEALTFRRPARAEPHRKEPCTFPSRVPWRRQSQFHRCASERPDVYGLRVGCHHRVVSRC